MKHFRIVYKRHKISVVESNESGGRWFQITVYLFTYIFVVTVRGMEKN